MSSITTQLGFEQAQTPFCCIGMSSRHSQPYLVIVAYCPHWHLSSTTDEYGGQVQIPFVTTASSGQVQEPSTILAPTGHRSGFIIYQISSLVKQLSFSALSCIMVCWSSVTCCCRPVII
ncbi:Hypothetical_protein [Hexamita inflata]|uniref:Hypothetical_protein n=1 Tax=Hexamita inflata TaxID=28002 RepID=A0AA86R3V2_9EUKA|nr:Hypothetical protein HINF_LOCUS53004 [Hexamita inflata]